LRDIIENVLIVYANKKVLILHARGLILYQGLMAYHLIVITLIVNL